MISLHDLSEEEKKKIRLKSPVELAFIGDAVFELLVREYITTHVDTSPNKLHSLAVSYVRAENQAHFLDTLFDDLTEDEQNVARRGRNASKTSVPKHADSRSYRMATGLEALFGYLYLMGESERIGELFRRITELMPVSGLLRPDGE